MPLILLVAAILAILLLTGVTILAFRSKNKK